MADNRATRFAGPVFTVGIGLIAATASSRLALGPGVADVEQPVAQAVFWAGLIIVLAGILWGVINLRSRYKP